MWDVKEAYGGSLQIVPMSQQDFAEPTLCVSWNKEGNAIFGGCCDNFIKMWDLAQNRVMNLGQHSAPVAQLQWCEELNMLFSMSWDKTVSLWDCRQQSPAMTMNMERKVAFFTDI